ncbi:activated RNA polymerase II transcriptional coactivator p15 [Orussus abietinus]|uniref:activated RNA polymerase II transcriptional coactivator p15 n=1 Tax=Orussus abietinus TaxID=222816 RepID=UPI0006257491|nr:activated RNA polymerase II transcriptional coactivator p15 [Orussus abietinus]XP_012283796.1 activated RNA polymerase II transcriptional coactivator p15 [Orussus abietinus]
MPKSKEYVSSSSTSGSDSESEDKKVKKQKKRKSEEHEEKPAPSKKPKKEEKSNEEPIWDLGNNRQVMVREFKGKLYVDIREMYFDKEGDLKPGKKGICLNMAQWRKFMSVVEEVDKEAKLRG